MTVLPCPHGVLSALVGNMAPMVLLPILMYENNVLVGQRVFFTALIMGAVGFVSFQFSIMGNPLRIFGGDFPCISVRG